MRDSTTIEIAERRIGPGEPVYLVAELSANHRQDLSEAKRLIEAAAECGADAVKLQTYTADTLTLDCDSPEFRIADGTPWSGAKLYDLYREAATPWEWHGELQSLANRLGLTLFSTPFDASAVEFLERLKMPAYKIASFELIDLPLVRAVARTGKPAIFSTGMATRAEIASAAEAFRGAGGTELALLKCTSAYPAPPDEANLRAMQTLRDAFGVASGLSDHTLDPAIPVAAVALGASIIEKHLTLKRSAGGSDSAFSLEPAEFAAMAKAVRTVEAALGSGEILPSKSEEACRAFRRSLYAVADIRAGEAITPENVRSIRPAGGLSPAEYESVLGRKARQAIARGTPLAWILIE